VRAGSARDHKNHGADDQRDITRAGRGVLERGSGRALIDVEQPSHRDEGSRHREHRQRGKPQAIACHEGGGEEDQWHGEKPATTLDDHRQLKTRARQREQQAAEQ
jgi:hypothetical protein